MDRYLFTKLLVMQRSTADPPTLEEKLRGDDTDISAGSAMMPDTERTAVNNASRLAKESSHLRIVQVPALGMPGEVVHGLLECGNGPLRSTIPELSLSETMLEFDPRSTCLFSDFIPVKCWQVAGEVGLSGSRVFSTDPAWFACRY